MRRLWRYLRRCYLKGWIAEYELAIVAERERHAKFDATIRAWQLEIARLKQQVERAGGRSASTSTLLSGLRRVK